MVITSLDTGGAESYLLRTLKRLVQEPVDIKVLCCASPGELSPKIEALGISVESAHLNSIRFWKALPALIKSFRFKPQLIHSWMYHGILLSAPLKVLSPKVQWLWSIRNPSVDSPHLPWTTRVLTRALPKLAFLCKDIIYNSSQAQVEHQRVGYPVEKGRLIHNGFLTVTSSQETCSQLRERLGLKSEQKWVLFASRFHPQKDPLTFCKTLQQAKKNIPNLKCIAIGQGLHKDNKDWMAALHHHQLEDTVISMGVRHDIQNWMKACDALILTSREESFPNVIGEALSLGTPVVTTKVGDQQHLCGSLVQLSPAGDWAALADTLRDVVNMNDQDRLDFQQTAKRWMAQNFSFEQKYQELVSLYPINIASHEDEGVRKVNQTN